MTAGGWPPTRMAPRSVLSAERARTTPGDSQSWWRQFGAYRPPRLSLTGVAIFDDKLVSRFEWFRRRPEDVTSTPPICMAFDCLYLEDRDLRPLPLRERRAALEQVAENDRTLIFPARHLATNGLAAWQQVNGTSA